MFDELDEGTDGCSRCGDECDCPLDEAPEVVRLRARVAELEDPDNWRCSDCGATYTQMQLVEDRADAAEAQVARVRALAATLRTEAEDAHGGLWDGLQDAARRIDGAIGGAP